MERKAYRDNLEMILDASAGVRLLSVGDVAKIMGRDRRFVRKMFPFNDGWISAATLARELSPHE